MTELFGVEIVIETTPAYQLLVITIFSDLTFLNDENLIGIFNCRETVGNDEAGSPAHELVHSFLDQGFGKGVDRTGGFIHDEDIWVRQQGAGNADKLFLTDRKLIAAFSNVRIVAFFKFSDEVMRSSQFGCLFDLLITGIKPAIAQVVADAA